MKRTKNIYLAVLAVLLSPMAANAVPVTWVYDGVITNCNAAICSLVPVFTGDPVTGEITIDVGANDSFTIDNTFADFEFLVGGVIPVVHSTVDPANHVLFAGGGTTGGTGDFASGSILGSFVGGTLGGLGGQVFVNFLTGDMEVTVGFGTVFVASVVGDFTRRGSMAVPEPGTLALFGLGLVGMAARRRRKV